MFANHIVNYKPINDFFKNKHTNEKALIIYKEDNINPIDLNIIANEVLIITNKNLKNKINNKKIKLINTILSPQNIVKEIENSKFKNTVQFKGILINDKKLKNVNNNKSCYLTDIEKSILDYIFINNTSSRKYIKEYILNIKTSVETNSLDSHLTRIRKKFNQINADLMIESKNDIIKIF